MFNTKKIKDLEYKNEYYRNQIEELKKQVSSISDELNSFKNNHETIVNEYESKIKQLMGYLNSKAKTPKSPKDNQVIITDEMQNVLNLVNDPDEKLIFVHGSAGTGKSTLLKYICNQYPKDDFVLLAPTGIAALNIDGATIHSFFQIPPANIYPCDNSNVTGFVREKLQSVNFIIIDEISMVRADLFDQLNSNLQYARKNNNFFGGVKLLLIGDLYQLPPILESKYYINYEKLGYRRNETFFFYSNAIKDFMSSHQKINYIELTHIFRQDDKEFINILQKCRLGMVDDNIIDYLLKRYVPVTSKEIINLVTTNKVADSKNLGEYKKLLTNEFFFTAKATGSFINQHPNNLPAPFEISLKEGTQVIITANNGKLYKNGTIGTIVAISDKGVTVKITNEDRTILVTPFTWELKEYDCNSTENSFSLKTKGTYTQIPLKYGWAITIHKSQGMTLENASIDFGNGTFCTGQGYVAVSRLRNYEGLYFLSSLKKENFRADRKIEEFLCKLKNRQY